MAISHSGGLLEIWNLKTLYKRADANAYRVLKNVCNADFLFYYEDEWLRLITLMNVTLTDNENSKVNHTQMIIQNIDTEQPNLI